MLFLLLALCTAQQLTPIPSPRDGFLLGPAWSNFTLDVFYDHLCVDSAAAFPGLYSYWQANQKWLGLRIHIFPLPYHPFSFVVAQAGRFIQTKYPSKFIGFVTYMFQRQELIINGEKNWDFATLQSKVALYTSQGTGVAYTEVLNALSDDDINWSSRVSWKYATSRFMSGTPRYILNGVYVPGVTGYTTAAQWSNYFEGFITKPDN
jgi:hypothetical protein